jgi:hypothetical protein
MATQSPGTANPVLSTSPQNQEQEELQVSLQLLSTLADRLNSAPTAITPEPSENSVNSLISEIAFLKSKAAQQAEAITMRTQLILDLTIQNDGLLRTLAEYRKHTQDTTSQFELLGKRDIRALEDHSTQTVVEVVQHHKALQVLRWDSVLGKECEGARARRSDDLKKLEEITRLLLANKKEINKEVKAGAVAEVGNKKVAGNENHK